MAANPAAANGGRGWLEGTLDVISNMKNSRPSTPVSSVFRGRPASAPNSPAGHTTTSVSVAAASASAAIPLITRLPSQDSMECSIHNESSHGNKSTAQMVRDLRHANARLTARTATMEADFMNQLNQATREAEEQLHKWRLEAQGWESRYTHADGRLKQYQEQCSKLKDESAFHRHTISELKTQLAAMQQQTQQQSGGVGCAVDSGGDENSTTSSSRSGRRELARLNAPLPTANQLERTQEALYRTETALVDLQNEQQRMQEVHASEVAELQQRLDSSDAKCKHIEQTWKTKFERAVEQDLTDNLGSQLATQEETVKELREQVLDYSSQLTALTEELARVKKNAEVQEQYRRDEADDLRVLNDAQEEEIDNLRKSLEEALREIEIREQEMEEKKIDDETDLAAQRRKMEEIEDTNRMLENLGKEVEDKTLEMRTLEQDILALGERKARMTADDDLERQEDAEQLLEMKGKVQAMETRQEVVERQLEEARTALKNADKSKETLAESLQTKIRELQAEKLSSEQSYEAQIASLREELGQARIQASKPPVSNTRSTASGEPSGDSPSMVELQHEVSRLKALLEQTSRESTAEFDLRQQLERTKGSEEQLRVQIETFSSREDELRRQLDSGDEAIVELQSKYRALEDARKSEVDQLREKLDDRDTAISSLLKSSIALEEELAATRVEMDALKNRIAGHDSGEAGYDVILAASLSRDEADDLRVCLDDSREAEKRLADENYALQDRLEEAREELDVMRSQLTVFQSENNLLRSQLDDDMASVGAPSSTFSTSSLSPAMQIQERDKAIANLVQQAMEQDKIVTELREKLLLVTQEAQTLRANKKSGPSWDEVKELRKETEMFAGQVIEQDEEIEELKARLHTRDKRLSALEAEIDELRSRPAPAPENVDDSAAEKIMRLSAEVDEFQEANSVLRDELRILRRKEREFEASADAIDRMRQEVQQAKITADDWSRRVDALVREKASLIDQLDDHEARVGVQTSQEEAGRQAASTIQQLQTKVKTLEARIAETANAATRVVDVDEIELEALRGEISHLRRDLDHQNAAVRSAKETIRELEQLLAEKAAGEAAGLEEEKEELMAEVENISRQLEEAHAELREFEQQRALIDDFKLKLEEADEARGASEKNIIDMYERKLSLLGLDKDVTIDKLRNELTDQKATSASDQENMTRRLQESAAEMEGFRERMEVEIQHRESRIFTLEKELQAHGQLVTNMKNEMDHLQGSMENTVISRREEIEGLHQEVADLSSTIAKQEQEIKSLKGQLEDRRVEHEAEVTKLRETIESLQNEQVNSEHRNAMDLKMELRVQEVKERLEKLKRHNASFQEENILLRDRLQKAEDQLHAGAIKQDRTLELERELAKQQKKVDDLTLQVAKLKETPPEPVSAPASSPSPSPAKPPVAQAPMPPPAPKASEIQAPLPPSAPNSEKKAPSPGPRRLGFLGRRRASSEASVGSSSRRSVGSKR